MRSMRLRCVCLCMILCSVAAAEKICKTSSQGGIACFDSADSGCSDRCTYNALRMTPEVIQGCAGVPIQQINVWVDGNGRMDVADATHHPNQVLSHKGAVDWDDTTSDPIFADTLNTKAEFSHKYTTAITYDPSAHYEATYEDAGVCTYTCSADIQVVATIFLASSPECASGAFKETANSKKTAQQALRQLQEKRLAASKNAKP